MSDNDENPDLSGTEVSRIEGRIAELEEQIERLEERRDGLKRYRERMAAPEGDGVDGADAPRQAVLNLVRRLAADYDSGVPEPQVYRVAGEDGGLSRDEIGDALATLKRNGEVYYPTDGRLRPTP